MVCLRHSFSAPSGRSVTAALQDLLWHSDAAAAEPCLQNAACTPALCAHTGPAAAGRPVPRGQGQRHAGLSSRQPGLATAAGPVQETAGLPAQAFTLHCEKSCSPGHSCVPLGAWVPQAWQWCQLPSRQLLEGSVTGCAGHGARHDWHCVESMSNPLPRELLMIACDAEMSAMAFAGGACCR